MGAGFISLYRREYEQAAVCFRSALELNPAGYVWPTGIRISTYLAYSLHSIGNHEDGEKALQQSDQLRMERSQTAYEPNIWPPLVFQDELAAYALRGERDRALKYLDGLIENGWKACILIDMNPLFEEFFKDPELQDLCESVKPEIDELRRQVEKKYPNQEKVPLFPSTGLN